MTPGDAIRAARTRAGVSQRELARRLGCPPATVARWETGRNAPSVETQRRVGDVLGVPVESVCPACGQEVTR